MKHFTPEEYKPSEMTLHLIRTIAHNYPSEEMGGNEQKQYWN